MPARAPSRRRWASPRWSSVLVLCLAGVTAVSMQVRCIDAAREAARLAARGDDAVGRRRRPPHRARWRAGPAAPGRRLRRRDRCRALKSVAHVGYCGQRGLGGRAAAMSGARPPSSRPRWSWCCCASPAPAPTWARRWWRATALRRRPIWPRWPPPRDCRRGSPRPARRATAVAREMRVDDARCRVDELDVVVTVAGARRFYRGGAGRRAGGTGRPPSRSVAFGRPASASSLSVGNRNETSPANVRPVRVPPG